MIQTGFESRVKVQDVIESQIPEFILDESPKVSEFLKQYYISQEYQSGPVDIVENLDQYLKLDNLTPEVVVGFTSLTSEITTSSTTIPVVSTKGFPQKYGLLKIDDEIITYTGITTNSFTGCIRGFSGVTDYHQDLDSEELLFSTSESESHSNNAQVKNLSALFLQEFYKKIKYSLLPGFENIDFDSNLNVGNFIKEARTFYSSKGTNESFRILFNVLYNETPKIIDLEQYLIKPSSATYVRREVVVSEAISGNPLNLVGQTIVKNTDTKTTASVSEVEKITRVGKEYYKLSLFIGYDDSSPTITGEFNITENTKNLDYVSVGSSVITVDSTIGFPNSGKIYSGINTITYTSKSINQFFGCSGITSGISTSSVIYSDNTYYGYENGDKLKKVVLRLTGVLSDYESKSDKDVFEVNEKIFVKNIGESIKKSEDNPTHKQIFANSWIYNTSSRYQIDTFSVNNSSTEFLLKENVDKTRIRVDDYVDVINRNSNVLVASNLRVIGISQKQITVSGSISFSSSFQYDIRRKIKTSTSSFVPLEFDQITSDVQNVYNENDDNMYVASNSLPSYNITKKIFSYDAISISKESQQSELYSVINFSDSVSFITGSEIYYTFSDTPISGLSEGVYYVEVLDDNRQIKLYLSRNFIGTENCITFGSTNIPQGTHNFTLNSQRQNILSPQKILRKFPLSINNGDGQSELTESGPVGMLVNGVEIINYKSEDKVYYGPLDSVNVLEGGSDYDVINPPLLTVSEGDALVQPIVRGSVEKIYVKPQDFDIDVIVSVNLTGGNGKGASFNPVIQKRRREIQFDARQTFLGGGVDVVNDTITFTSKHNLIDGEQIVYRPGNFQPLGIGDYRGDNFDTGENLKSEASYYVKYVNDTTIQLHETFSDYVSGINTVGFTTIGTSGIQKFVTLPKNTLSEIKVVNPGFGFENRKLRVSPSGISTTDDTVKFINHGFKTGEIVTYEYETLGVGGLSTTNQYYIIKIDNDTFRLSDAGIGGTYIGNYQRGKYVKLTSPGTGYQIFNYPQIELSVEYSAVGLSSSQFRGTIDAIPVVKGSIVGTYVYNSGQDYGSQVLNQHNKPTISIKTGKSAQLKPIIVNGRIEKVSVQYGGVDYYSTPNIKVVGSGIGAILLPIMSNNKILDVIVLNSGSGYSESDTKIIAESSGKGAILDCQVRSLTVNNCIFYKDNNDPNQPSVVSEILKSSNNNLQYSICSYSNFIGNNFGDNGSTHSPIIGWAYDGNPIYGSYGYSNSSNINSPIRRLGSGYTLTTVSNRPAEFPLGFFVEDYEFSNSGDLDEYNGRFCKTPDFPNGVYAYFATTIVDSNRNVVGSFPYFIGNRYRSKYLKENKLLNQNFDFNNSELIRNTFPYGIDSEYSSNDFILDFNDVKNQATIVESVTSGSIDGFEILNSGESYKVGDSLLFNEDGTDGGGLLSQVSEIEGKEIETIETTIENYNDVIFTWSDGEKIKAKISPNHTLKNLDLINVSGFSSSTSFLNGTYTIGVTSYSTTLLSDIPSFSSTGIVTDIYVANIPENISIGSSIRIDSETFSIINVFEKENVIRVSRLSTGVTHTASTNVNYIPDSFVIEKSFDYFNSKENDLIYFNPRQSIGVGTEIGITTSVNYVTGTQSKSISIPTQSIYLPNHTFSNNQQVTLVKPSSASAISVANTSDGSSFNIPYSGNEQTVYVIKHSKDYIGIVTQVGLTTTAKGLFFTSNGSNDYRYSFKTNYEQVTGNVKKITSKITVDSTHSLKDGDTIKLVINPNVSVGLGTTTPVTVRYDSQRDRLLFNPKTFSSSGINTITDTITINNHNFKTGDKLLYTASSPANGLTTGFYYAYKVDENTIQLSETYNDTISNPPLIVDIVSNTSTANQLSLVNPEINLVKNNNLVFNLSHSSLSGYKFKIYFDNQFKDEFLSNGKSTTFLISASGTPGTSGASLTLNTDEYLDYPLFYALEKSGDIKGIDKDVKNYSKINFINSFYSGSYTISGVATTSFNINLPYTPESTFYSRQSCDIIKYTTSSNNSLGGISKIRILSPGYGFKNLPIFSGVDSEFGKGAYILPNSSSIGKINQFRIVNEGFDYHSDKTLRPQSLVSKTLILKNRSAIESVDVLYGGKNYKSSPDIIIVDSSTGLEITSGKFVANVVNSSISNVEVFDVPKGLSESVVNVVAINNSNGVGISSAQSSSSGIVTCTLVTPETGFRVEPFAIGDKIFVEGIEIVSNSGDGLNSKDYGYSFFTVSNYLNGGTELDRKVIFDLSEFTSNPGIASTSQNFRASIVNYKDYPLFNPIQLISDFTDGESIEVNTENGFVEKDLKVVKFDNNFVKVSGFYEPRVGDIIKGSLSGSLATIENIISPSGQFNVNYSEVKRVGWTDDIGKVGENTQVIPDNDYYQNLSYSIKSGQEWTNIVSPVNNLVHTSGLKNFADTELINNADIRVGVPTDSEKNTISIYDIINENRVDTINNYDLVVDYDVEDGTSRYLKFVNRQFANYLNASTNRVLIIDDISDKFLNDEFDLFNNIVEIDPSRKYEKYIVQITNSDFSKIKIVELVVLTDDTNIYTIEKSSLTNGEFFVGDISGEIDDCKNDGGYYLRFYPEDPYNTSYNIKYLNTNFIRTLSGIGTTTLGFTNLSGLSEIVSAGSTAILLEGDISSLESIYSEVHIIDNSTNKMNYVEVFVVHDGINAFISETHSDTYSNDIVSELIGSFQASIDGGVLSLKYENTTSNNLTVRTRNIGFGNTSLGIGTYVFNPSGQSIDSEKTVKYESSFVNVSSSSTIFEFDSSKISSLKSTIKIGIGTINSLHQIIAITDGTDFYSIQYPFLTINSPNGIGTFGGDINGSIVSLKFYPDPEFNGNFEILSFNQLFYSQNDYLNVSETLEYGSVVESVGVSNYISISENSGGDPDDPTADLGNTIFDLTYDGIPIFEKRFNPNDSEIFDFETSTFKIQNHFFSTGEELIYTPTSTLSGINAIPMGIASTANNVGVVTNLLPSTVYAIRDNNDSFRIATRKEYAIANPAIAVSFTSIGSGNIHKFEMVKKSEKSIISIDNLVQYPLSYSLLEYTVNNGGIINRTDKIIGLSSITSINLGDILKIDNEYMKVINVGFGTTYSGPISLGGTFPLAQVRRGFVGTSATSHSDFSAVKLYRGSFNIVGSKIYFTEPPNGTSQCGVLDSLNLPASKSYFNGRVFLRKDYTTNKIYDNISEKFTGIGNTYTLTINGINTTGVGATYGSGVVFINGIFQSPSTENNISGNFSILDDINVGITSIIFSGNNSSILSDTDVNLNDLPRGGIIVSLGSTPGLGYAPLVGASVTAIVSSGSIIEIGIGTIGNWGSGYRNPVSVAVTEIGHSGTPASITANVGLGGTLSFNIADGGTGYTNPSIIISAPSYNNLPVTGVYRSGIGLTSETGTGLLLNIDVGPASTTGIGSTLFEVRKFEVVRNGFNFKKGDIIKPVGLVTAQGLSNPLYDFELTVLETFNDSFASWEFGQLDYIDSIKKYQNGVRTRFPLYYNSQLISFNKNPDNPDSQLIDFNALLLIFVNGILQKPVESYTFEGGSSFTFTIPPKVEDNIQIFFYRGSEQDNSIVLVNETIKIGDTVQVFSNNNKLGITTTQNPRTVFDIPSSDIIETNLYDLQGIDETNSKPLYWTKQKVDKVINGDVVFKSRDSLEAQIYPTSKIIRSFNSTDNYFFVDDAKFFNYENELSIDFDAFVISGQQDPVSAAVTAIVSSSGTLESLSIVNPGYGYTGTSVTVKISSPPSIGIGIGTTATASISVVDGILSEPITITNAGFGYTQSNPPQVIVPLPKPNYENILNITSVEGFSGKIIGIETSSGIGTDLALKFTVDTSISLSGLTTNYPIYIFDTIVGNGVTSIIDSDSSAVGVGTTFLDNIYNISSINEETGVIICNIHSSSSVVGIATTGEVVGKFSWGKLSGFSRTSKISVDVSSYVVDSGLSTFPTIQRRGFGLRNNGSLQKTL